MVEPDSISVGSLSPRQTTALGENARILYSVNYANMSSQPGRENAI